MPRRFILRVLGVAALIVAGSVVIAQTTKTNAKGTRAYQAADPNPVDPTVIRELVGTWENELQSLLVISDIDQQSGAITGSYQTQKGDGTAGEEFPLNGWVNTSPPDSAHKDHVIVVEFSVRWGKQGTVTAWNGYYDTPTGKQPVIVGQWLLSRPNSDFEWDHIFAGQDQFHSVRK